MTLWKCVEVKWFKWWQQLETSRSSHCRGLRCLLRGGRVRCCQQWSCCSEACSPSSIHCRKRKCHHFRSTWIRTHGRGIYPAKKVKGIKKTRAKWLMTIVLPAICWYFWGMGYMLLPLLRKGTGLATGCESHPFSVHCASGHSNCDLHTAGSALQTPFPGRCSPMGLWWWFQWSAGTENRTRSARCNPSHKMQQVFPV